MFPFKWNSEIPRSDSAGLSQDSDIDPVRSSLRRRERGSLCPPCPPAVMQVGSTESESPQWRGSHLCRAGDSLWKSIAQGPHVVEQKIGVKENLLVVERSDVARGGGH